MSGSAKFYHVSSQIVTTSRNWILALLSFLIFFPLCNLQLLSLLFEIRDPPDILAVCSGLEQELAQGVVYREQRRNELRRCR